jgi:hypothetical protein
VTAVTVPVTVTPSVRHKPYRHPHRYALVRVGLPGRDGVPRLLPHPYPEVGGKAGQAVGVALADRAQLPGRAAAVELQQEYGAFAVREGRRTEEDRVGTGLGGADQHILDLPEGVGRVVGSQLPTRITRSTSAGSAAGSTSTRSGPSASAARCRTAPDSADGWL